MSLYKEHDQKTLTNKTQVKVNRGNYKKLLLNFLGVNKAGQTLVPDDIVSIKLKTNREVIDISGKYLKHLIEKWHGVLPVESTAAAAFDWSIPLPSSRPNEENARYVDEDMIVVVEIAAATYTAKVDAAAAQPLLTVLGAETETISKYQLFIKELDYTLTSGQKGGLDLKSGEYNKIMGILIDPNGNTLDTIEYKDSKGERMSTRLKIQNHDSNIENRLETADTGVTYIDFDQDVMLLNTYTENPDIKIKCVTAGANPIKVIIVYHQYDVNKFDSTKGLLRQTLKREVLSRMKNGVLQESNGLDTLAKISGYDSVAAMAADLGV